RHGESEGGGGGRRGAGGVQARGGGTDCPRIIGGEGQHRDTIKGAARGDDSQRVEQTRRRLEADEVIAPRWHAAGAGRVGPQGEADEAGGDGDRRAGTRPAGDVLGIEGVAADAVGAAVAGQPGAELVEVGLADEDGAYLLEIGDDRGRPFRDVGVRRTTGRGGPAGHVDVVLDGEGNAVEGQRLPGRVALLDPGGFRQD